MRAAVLREPGQPMEIEDIQVSKPRSREVLVRTIAAGVCHSDLHVQTGSCPYPLPVVLGHESAGIVEEVGSEVTYLKKGDHVVTCLSVFCGHCNKCVSGHPNLCQSSELWRAAGDESRLHKAGETIHQFEGLGSFAELVLTHEHSLVKITPDMPLDRAALLGCSSITGVGSVFHTADVEPGSSVAVIGCGGVGLAAVNGAAIAGAGMIIAIDKQESKLELAKTMGATHLINAGSPDVVAEVMELTRGGCDYTFEAIGLKATTEQAYQMLGMGGTATVMGLFAPDVNVELPGIEFMMEKKIQGSRMGSNRFRLDMPRLVDFYLNGKLHLDPLISRHIRLEDLSDAFAALEKGEDARHVIMFDN